MKAFLALTVLFLSGVSVALAKPQNISLHMVYERTESLDLGAPGPSTGDISVNYGSIYDAKTNALIGSYVARRIVLSIDAASGLDQRDNFVQLTLPLGNVYIIGVSTINTKLNVTAVSSKDPIVGGTGYYEGARGESRLIPVDIANGKFTNNLEFK